MHHASPPSPLPGCAFGAAPAAERAIASAGAAVITKYVRWRLHYMPAHMGILPWLDAPPYLDTRPWLGTSFPAPAASAPGEAEAETPTQGQNAAGQDAHARQYLWFFTCGVELSEGPYGGLHSPSCVQTPVFSGPRQPGSCMRSRGSWPGVSGICFTPLGPGGASNHNQEGNALLQ